MLQTATVVSWPIMAGRPRTPEGEKIRNDILKYLRRLELANAPKPTFAEVGTAVGRSYRVAFNYLESMNRDGFVTWVKGSPRTLSLTDTGRSEADRLLAPSANPSN